MTADNIKRALKTCSVPSACIGCVYKDADECIRALITDALELVDNQAERIAIMQESMDAMEKRNEPIKPDSIMTTSAGVPMSHCPNCNEPINQYRHPKFCGACGQAVKWE